MNKKLIVILSVLSLCVTVTACSKNNDNKNSQKSTNKTSINIESLENESVSNPDTYIKLGTETTIEGQGAQVSNNKVTITKAGTYSVSGKVEDGQIIVNAGGGNDKFSSSGNGLINIIGTNITQVGASSNNMRGLGRKMQHNTNV